MIQAIGLTSTPRRHRATAVDDVSFEAEPGRMTALLGAPSSGKTTVLRLMLELQRGRGITHFRGRPLHRITHPAREVGVVLGEVPGHPARTVQGQLRMLCAAGGVPVRRADEVMEALWLTEVRGVRLGTLPRGLDRALGLACALLPDPHTLVLDDPVGDLSAREGRPLLRLLREHAAQGGTVLFSTEDPKEASRSADRVVTLDRGRLVADQAAADFARTRLRPRVVVRSPQAARLSLLLAKEARAARHAVEIVRESGSRLSVYGSSCAGIGEIAYRHGVLIHQLADEVGDMGPSATVDQAAPARTGDAPEADSPDAVTVAAATPPRRMQGVIRTTAQRASGPSKPAYLRTVGGTATEAGDSPRAGKLPRANEPTPPGPAHPTEPVRRGELSPPPEASHSPGTPHLPELPWPAEPRSNATAGPVPTNQVQRPRDAPGSPPVPAVPAIPPAPRQGVPSPALPPVLVRPARGPLRPLRYELYRAAGVATGYVTMACALLASAVICLLIARTGHTPRPRLLVAWPRELPLPPAALGAGLLGALAFGEEFRHPALAADRGAVPRRLGLLTAKLLVAGGTALLFAVLTLGCDAAVLQLVYGPELTRIPADWPTLAASWACLTMGCACAGVLAAGVFRSTAAGLAAVLAVPVAVVPLVHRLLAGPSVHTAAGFPDRVRNLVLMQWPFGAGRYLAAGVEMVVQPVGAALALSLAALLSAYALTGLRGGPR